MLLSSSDETLSTESLRTFLDNRIAEAKEFSTSFDNNASMKEHKEALAEPSAHGDYNGKTIKNKKRKHFEVEATEAENLLEDDIQNLYETLHLKKKKKKHNKSNVFQGDNEESIANAINNLLKKEKVIIKSCRLEGNNKEASYVEGLDSNLLKKKKKHKGPKIVEENYPEGNNAEKSYVEDLDGNLSKKKKKKHKGPSTVKENHSKGTESEESYVKGLDGNLLKKKKHKGPSIMEKNHSEGTKSRESYVEGLYSNLSKKKKHKGPSIVEKNHSEGTKSEESYVEGLDSNLSKKKKRKGPSIVEKNHSEGTKSEESYMEGLDSNLSKKKKHKGHSIMEKNNSEGTKSEENYVEGLDSNFTKKKKHKGLSIVEINHSEGTKSEESYVEGLYSNLSKKKKHKGPTIMEQNHSESTKSEESCVEVLDSNLSKKKKHKGPSIVEKNHSEGTKLEESYVEGLGSNLSKKKKKKHKGPSIVEKNHSEGTKSEESYVEGLDSNLSKKKKHKGPSIVEKNHSEGTKSEESYVEGLGSNLSKKKKHKGPSIVEKNHSEGTKSEESYVEGLDSNLSKKKKKKHKGPSIVEKNYSEGTKSEVSYVEGLDSNLSKKKKKKHKGPSIVEENHPEGNNTEESYMEDFDGNLLEKKHKGPSTLKENYPDDKSKTKKHKQAADENDQSLETDVRNSSEAKKKKKHTGFNILENMEENNPAIKLDDISEKKKQKKHQVTDTENNQSLETAVENSGKVNKREKHKHKSSVSEDENASKSLQSPFEKQKHTHFEENKPESQTDTVSAENDVGNSDENITKKRRKDEVKKNGILDDENVNSNSFRKLKRSRSHSDVENLNESNSPNKLHRSDEEDNESTGHNTGKILNKNKIHYSEIYSDTETSIIDAINFVELKYDRITDSLDEAVEKIEQQNEADAENRLNILTGLHVMISWNIPESHRIETRLSHPTPEQFKRLKTFDMKTRSFSKQEDNQIRTNWREFCKIHDLKDVPPSIFFPSEDIGIYKNFPTCERIKFGQYLAKNLPHRTLSSVYQRFQLLFSVYKKGLFNPEEDKIIMTFMEQSTSPKRFSILAKILNRPRAHVRLHYNYLKAKRDLVGDSSTNIPQASKKEIRVKWSKNEMESLIKHLLDVTKQANINKLEELKITPIHWKEAALRMNTSPRRLNEKWNLDIYPGLFVRDYTTVNEIQEKLIDIFYNSEIKDSKNVKWNELVREFRGFTRNRLYKIFMDLKNLILKHHRKVNFREEVVLLKDYLKANKLKIKPLLKLEWDGLLGELKFL